MNAAEVFRRITAALARAGIPYMLTGSFASASYGAPRTTQDIDLVIEASQAQLQMLVELLSPSEYYVDLDAALEARQRESQFNVLDIGTGWKIDLILRKSRAFSREEFQRRQRVRLEGLDLFIASAEDVVISKLEWARRGNSLRQIEDVAAILRSRFQLLDQLYLEKWIGELGVADQWNSARRAAGLGE